MPNPNVLKYVGRVTWLHVSGYDAFVKLETGQLFHLSNADPDSAVTTCLYLSIFQVSAVTGQPVVVSVPRADTAHIIGVDMAMTPPPAYAPANHNHAGVYEPVINPKRTAFNVDFGAGNVDAARGDHMHDALYNKKLVSGHLQDPTCRNSATGEVWVDFTISSASAVADLQPVILGFGASTGGTSFFDVVITNPTITAQGGTTYRLDFQVRDVAGAVYDPANPPWNGRKLHVMYLVTDSH